MLISKRVLTFTALVFLLILLQGFFTPQGFTLPLLIWAIVIGLLVLVLGGIVEKNLQQRND